MVLRPPEEKHSAGCQLKWSATNANLLLPLLLLLFELAKLARPNGLTTANRLLKAPFELQGGWLNLMRQRWRAGGLYKYIVLAFVVVVVVLSQLAHDITSGAWLTCKTTISYPEQHNLNTTVRFARNANFLLSHLLLIISLLIIMIQADAIETAAILCAILRRPSRVIGFNSLFNVCANAHCNLLADSISGNRLASLIATASGEGWLVACGARGKESSQSDESLCCRCMLLPAKAGNPREWLA